MAPRRKPNTFYTQLNDDNDEDAPPVRSSIMRYALSDAPLPSLDSSFDYDKIDAAVASVQQRFSAPRTSPARQPSLPPVPEASEEGSLAGEEATLSRHSSSSSSGITIVGQRYVVDGDVLTCPVVTYERQGVHCTVNLWP